MLAMGWVIPCCVARACLLWPVQASCGHVSCAAQFSCAEPSILAKHESQQPIFIAASRNLFQSAAAALSNVVLIGLGHVRS